MSIKQKLLYTHFFFAINYPVVYRIMRLDLFLKASRLCLRRSVAQEMCDAGVVSVNGGVAKPSKDLRVGDRIAIRRRNKILTIVVNTIPASKQVARDDASTLYTIVGDETLAES